MAYLSLYRKYRSQTFGDLIGQDHVVRTIQNGIASGRIAHSYLFTGPRGTGKTSTARLLAKALCCEHGPTPEPDNTCPICREITAGSCVDVIEMDAASESGVDDIREQIVEVTEYRPMVCRYKIFIIDEVHDLSAKAFDALLKTIEEPPAHIIFILATTEFNKVPPTIRSRCQKYEFHRASLQDLVSRLSYVAEAEGVRAEPAALTAIARMADGGYRDGLTLLEQAILTSQNGEITLQQVYDQLGLVSEETVDQLLVAIREIDVPNIMEVLAGIARLGRDPRAILESMMVRLSDLTRASYQVQTGVTADAAREATLHETASRLGRDFILRMRGDLASAHKVIRDISLPRLWLESELLRLAVAKTSAPLPGPTPAREAPRREMPSRPETQRPEIPRSETSRPEAQKPEPQRLEPQQTEPSSPEPVSTEPASEETPPPVEAASTPIEERSVPQTPVASDEWSRIYEDLKTISATLGRKLVTARIAARNADVVVIEFERAMDLEWLTAKPAASTQVQKTVRKHLGENVEVTYRSVGKQRLEDDPVVVELPSEGDRLEQLVKEVFGL